MEPLATALPPVPLVPNTLPPHLRYHSHLQAQGTYSGADLTAVTGPSTDIDGDAVEYRYEWYNPSGVLG